MTNIIYFFKRIAWVIQIHITLFDSFLVLLFSTIFRSPCLDCVFILVNPVCLKGTFASSVLCSEICNPRHMEVKGTDGCRIEANL